MPRKEDQKNWKIKECFISKRDGWCNYCHRTWKKGHKIYWMEKPNHTGWAACTDKKCYQEQGGKITPVERKKKDTPKNIGLDEFHGPSNEVKTPEEEAKLPGEVHEHEDVCPLCRGTNQVIVNNLVKQLEAYGYQVSLKRWDSI